MDHMIFSPEGCHMLVDDIVSELTLEHRAEKAGLKLVVENANRPKNTMGTIVALGDDPYMYEIINVKGKKRQRWQVGDVVSFAWTAGHLQIIEDHEFRNIVWQDITGTFRPERSEELADLSPYIGGGTQSVQCPPPEPVASQSDTVSAAPSPSVTENTGLPELLLEIDHNRLPSGQNRKLET